MTATTSDRDPLPPRRATDLSRRATLRLGAGGLTAALAARGLRGAVAQEATPAAPVGGFTFERLAEGTPAAAPGLRLSLGRVTLAPGGFVAAHTHPGSTLLVAESGSSVWTLVDGEAWLTRAAAGTPAAGAPEPAERIATPGDVELGPGDSLFYNEAGAGGLVVHRVENRGDQPAVILGAQLLAADQPEITFTNDAGTPAP